VEPQYMEGTLKGGRQAKLVRLSQAGRF